MARQEPLRGDAEPKRFAPDALTSLPPELALARLPAGRHGLPRSFVVSNQRLRIVAAMVQALPQHGFHGVTIRHLTREAGVSRAAFYEQFENKEECFLATYELAVQWLCGRVVQAAAAEEEWPARVRAGVTTAVDLLAANPDLAHLIALEADQAGPVARERQQAGIGRLAEALRAGRPADADVPSNLEELLIGGALSLIARYVDTGRTEHLPATAAKLIQCLLLPYLGPGETRRFMARAA